MLHFFHFLQLTGVNDKMVEFTAGTSPHNSGLMHTLQRHRDILQVFNNVHVLLSLTEECNSYTTYE